MAAINGTITAVNMVEGNPGTKGTRKLYAITATFAAYTGAADTAARRRLSRPHCSSETSP